MKSLHKIVALFVLSTLLHTGIIYGQKNQAEDYAEKAESAQEKAEEERDNILEIFKEKDCDELRSSDKRKIKKAMDELKEQVGLAGTAAKEAWDAVLEAKDSEKAEAKKFAEAADKAVKKAEDALAKALEKTPGISKADEIIEALDDVDVSNHSKKEDMVEELKNASRNAGYKYPCDPDLVKKEVEQKVDELVRENRNNQELDKWTRELKESLKEKELIYFAVPGAERIEQAQVNGTSRFSPVLTVRVYAGKELMSDKGAGYAAQDQLNTCRDNLYADPELLESMFTTLGGEFFIGDFSGNAQVTQVARIHPVLVGMLIQYRLLSRFALEGSIQYGKGEITGRFPVTVFDGTTGETRSRDGKLRIPERYLTGRVGGTYTVSEGTVRPFAGAGIQFNRIAQSGAQIEIEEKAISTNSTHSNHSVGLYAKTGIEVHPSQNLLLVATFFVGTGKVQTGATEKATIVTPGFSVGAGVKF